MSLQRGHLYEFGEFRLDTASKRLLRDGQIVTLTPKAVDLLVALVESHGRTLSKEELLKTVWPDTYVEEGNLTQNVSVLRKALAAAAGGEDYILTIPREGYRFIAPVREFSSGGADAAQAADQSPLTPAGRGRPQWIWAAAASLAAAGLIAAWVAFRPPRNASAPHPIQLSVNPPIGGDIRSQSGSAISPDGTLVAFVAHGPDAPDRLWIRSLDSPVPRELPGTEGATFPFWKPDSRAVGFFASEKLKRIDVDGTNLAVICDAPSNRGATWNGGDVIVFPRGNDTPLQRVSARGGVPQLLTTVEEGENSHRWPQFLPDGRHLLFFVRAGDGVHTENSRKMGVYLTSLENPRKKILLVTNSSSGGYRPGTDGQPGQLLWVRDGRLMAQPFEFWSGRLSGEPTQITEPVYTFMSGGFFSASENGSLLCERAPSFKSSIVWFGRDGKPLGTLASPDYYLGLRFSPDGKRVAVERMDDQGPGASNTWIVDVDRPIPMRLTSSYGMSPVWSPDGKNIAYGGPGPTGSPPNLYSRDAHGAAAEQRLSQGHNTQTPEDWSPDGRFLLYKELPNEGNTGTPAGLRLLPLNGGGNPSRLTEGKFAERNARFSPDGKWISYTSNRSGIDEIYIEKFPPDGAPRLVSSQGGDVARWRSDGRELFYLSPRRTLMSVPINLVGKSLELGVPSELFRLPDAHVTGDHQIYDVAPDGRFLMLAPAGEIETSRLFVLLALPLASGRTSVQ